MKSVDAHIYIQYVKFKMKNCKANKKKIPIYFPRFQGGDKIICTFARGSSQNLVTPVQACCFSCISLRGWGERGGIFLGSMPTSIRDFVCVCVCVYISIVLFRFGLKMIILFPV